MTIWPFGITGIINVAQLKKWKSFCLSSNASLLSELESSSVEGQSIKTVPLFADSLALYDFLLLWSGRRVAFVARQKDRQTDRQTDRQPLFQHD